MEKLHQILVQQKQAQVHSPSPMDSDDSDPEPTASDVSLGQHLNETDWSQPTPCNSCEQSPVPARSCHHDDSLVELEASQDELDELDQDESTEVSMETSQDSQILKCQLHEKCKQVKKAEKQARIQQLWSQLVQTDHQLDVLPQKASVKPTLGTGTNQPAATSTP